MAIRNRRGLYTEFDPNKLVSGEFAFPLDTKEVYYCIAPGDVRRVATKEDLQQILTSSPEAFSALQVLLADLESDVDLSTTILNDIANLQTDKLDKVGDSKDNITTFTEFATDTDVASGEKHETLFSKLLKNIKTLRSGKIDKTSIGQTDTVNDVNKVASTTVTYAHGQRLNELTNNLATITSTDYIPVIMHEAVAGTLHSSLIFLANAKSKTITITYFGITGTASFGEHIPSITIYKTNNGFYLETNNTSLFAYKERAFTMQVTIS